MTEALIARLTDDLKPVPPSRLRMWLIVSASAGLGLSAVVMWIWFGPRPDLAAASATPRFWMKFGYTLALGALGLWAAKRVARPGGTGRVPLLLVPAVIALLASIALIDYALAPVQDQQRMVWGSSALMCPFYIFATSIPLLFAVFVFLRRMAPTHLSRAGLAGGLAAGSLGAWIYTFHCTESGLPFLAIWYSAGILIVSILGLLSGRWVLRW